MEGLLFDFNVPAGPPREIFTATNPVDLPRIDRAALVGGTDDGIYVESQANVRLLRREGAAFVDDPDGTGLFSDGIGPATYQYPPIFAAGVSNARLVGYRTILTPRQQFFTDEGYVEQHILDGQLRRISSAEPFANEMTGLAPAGAPREFRFEANGRPQVRIEGEALVLSSDEPLSYGSFLFRILPKMKSIQDLRLIQTRCIVYAKPRPFMDLLNLCGLPENRIIQHDHDAVLHIDRAIVPCMRNPHAYLDPGTFDFYEELRAMHGVHPTGRKLYVSRFGLNKSGRGASRIMTNEAELIATLDAAGFDIIEPETMTVRAQIMAFSSASVIVGPSGSGLFNTMFCHPGTKIIDIQSEPQWIYSYTGMYGSLKLDWGIFVGKSDPADTKPVHRQFSVNIRALMARLRSFLADASW